MLEDEKKEGIGQTWKELRLKWNKARQRWIEARPTKKIVFWISVAVSILTIFVGFNWGGWVTSTKAEHQAAEAVVERLSLICVGHFKEDPETEQKLIEFIETRSYQQADFVRDQGWATMVGDDEPDNNVVRACTKLIALIDQ